MLINADSRCPLIVRSLAEYTGLMLRTRSPDAALHANQFQLPRRAHYPPVALSASLSDTLVAELLLLLRRVSALVLPSASARPTSNTQTAQPEAVATGTVPKANSLQQQNAASEQSASSPQSQSRRPFAEALAALIFTGLEGATQLLRDENPSLPGDGTSPELDLMLFAVACVTFVDDRLRLGALVRHEKLGVGVVTRVFLNGRISVTYLSPTATEGLSSASAPASASPSVAAAATTSIVPAAQQYNQTAPQQPQVDTLVLRAEPAAQASTCATSALAVVGADTKRALLRLLAGLDAERFVRLVQDHCLPLVLSAPLLRNLISTQPTSPLNVAKVCLLDFTGS